MERPCSAVLNPHTGEQTMEIELGVLESCLNSGVGADAEVPRQEQVFATKRTFQ